MAARRKTPKQRRYFSIPFLLAIPGNFIIGIICLLSIVLLLRAHQADDAWTAFLVVLLSAIIVFARSSMKRLRILIHEIKHALVVSLTGNRVTNIEVQQNSGHVDYELYQDGVKFGPIIALAPYFFPLFSLPALAACLVFEDYYRLALAVLLAVCLAFDICTAWGDIHPWQSDFKQIFGGRLTALSYLAGTHLAWLSFCFLWPLAGRAGYIFAANVFLNIAGRISGG